MEINFLAILLAQNGLQANAYFQDNTEMASLIKAGLADMNAHQQCTNQCSESEDLIPHCKASCEQENNDLKCSDGMIWNSQKGSCEENVFTAATTRITTKDNLDWGDRAYNDGEFYITCGGRRSQYGSGKHEVTSYNMSTQEIIRTYNVAADPRAWNPIETNPILDCTVVGDYVIGSTSYGHASGQYWFQNSYIYVWDKDTGKELLHIDANDAYRILATATHLFVYERGDTLFFIKLSEIDSLIDLTAEDYSTTRLENIFYASNKPHGRGRVNGKKTVGAHGENAIIQNMAAYGDFLYTTDSEKQLRKWRIDDGKLVAAYGERRVAVAAPIAYGDYLISQTGDKLCVMKSTLDLNYPLHCINLNNKRSFNTFVFGFKDGIAYTIKTEEGSSDYGYSWENCTMVDTEEICKTEYRGTYIIAYNIDKVIAGERDSEKLIEKRFLEGYNGLKYSNINWGPSPYIAPTVFTFFTTNLRIHENQMWISGRYLNIKMFKFDPNE